MLQILDQSMGALVGLRVWGKFTRADLERATGYISQARHASDRPIRLVVEVAELTGAEPAALWADLTYSLRHRNDFERVAIVADQVWIAWWSRLGGTLAAAEVRHFKRADLDRAWAWIRA